MEIVLGLCLVAFAGMGFLIVSTWAIVKLRLWLAFRRKAKQDFEAARGTQHCRLVQQAVRNLQYKIRVNQKDLEETQEKLKHLNQEKSRKLDRALEAYIVEARLTEVSGIGERLSQEILKKVFRGSLSDLHQTHGRVNGVGQARQRAISQWVNSVQSRLPELRSLNFPGKAEIEEEYLSERRRLKVRIEVIQGKLEEMHSLKSMAEMHQKKFADITPATFRKALKGGAVADDLSEYHLGFFAPWETPPDWFEKLISNYGGI